MTVVGVLSYEALSSGILSWQFFWDNRRWRLRSVKDWDTGRRTPTRFIRYRTLLYCTLAHPFGLKKNKNPLPEQDAGDEANTNVFVRTTIGPSNRDEVYSICIALELPICRRIFARN